MDSEQLLVCPYDLSHRIRRSRFPYHVVKCRKNHPKLANVIKVCPFNARHQIHKAEFKRHLLHCEDGKLTAEGSSAQRAESEYPPDCANVAQQAADGEGFPSGENWDDDEAEATSPFVFGKGRKSVLHRARE